MAKHNFASEYHQIETERFCCCCCCFLFFLPFCVGSYGFHL
uniref:Uncharacterized protein n=1 Tax=Arundo donax TaxID=35708 RepID=A0A0A9I2H7_ARUDO